MRLKKPLSLAMALALTLAVAAGVQIEPAQAQAQAKSVGVMLAEALVSPNPYALAVKYRDQRTPGSYAIATDLISTCRFVFERAQAARYDFEHPAPKRLSWMPASNDGMAPAVVAKRTAAVQAIDARCRPFVDDQGLEQSLADDVDGKSARELNLKGRMQDPPSADLEAMLALLVKQGTLWHTPDVLSRQEGSFGHFDGRPRGGLSEQEFVKAMRLGAILATSSEQGWAEDLRSMDACAYQAQCDADLARLVLGDFAKDPESAARIKALAQQVSVALRAGELERFRRKR